MAVWHSNTCTHTHNVSIQHMELFPAKSLLWSTIIQTVALPYKMKLVCKTFKTRGIFNARLLGIFSSEHEKSTYFTVPHTARGNVRNVERWEMSLKGNILHQVQVVVCYKHLSRRLRLQDMVWELSVGPMAHIWKQVGGSRNSMEDYKQFTV